MSAVPGKQSRGPLRHLGVMAVLAAVLVLAVFVTLRVIFDQKHALVVRSWEQRVGSPEDLLERYPARSANASALRVEELGAALGIDMAPRWAQDRARPTDAQRLAFRGILPHAYLNTQIERADPAIDEPPADLVEFLDAHSRTLDALRGQLVTAEPPRWEFALRAGNIGEIAIPNLLGHINMQKLLLTDALVRGRAGDRRGALRSVEASWRLGSAIDGDPVLITQLIAITGARLRCGVLRKLRDVPEVWRDRLLALDYRGPFFDAMTLEGWQLLQLADSQPMEVAQSGVEQPVLFNGILNSALGWLGEPYVRACVADVLDDYQRYLARLAKLDYWCDRNLSAAIPLGTAWWNRLGALFGGVPDAPSRLARLELDQELTGLVLASRNGDADPREVPSRACPQDRWIRRLDAAGTLTIELSRSVEWPERSGAVLPTRFTIGPG